ncbi:MAG: hypothetical protein ACQEUO_01765 [Bacillota bacterium]|uniref:hypothetical protein n=1 Tax=Bacillus TaxID=1386 RepID=UPI002E1E92B9|nr:hypothetical protein [Bacillus zhangzhouensis]
MIEIVEIENPLKIKHDESAEDHSYIETPARWKESSKTNPLQAMRSIEKVVGRCDKKGKSCSISGPFQKRKKAKRCLQKRGHE